MATKLSGTRDPQTDEESRPRQYTRVPSRATQVGPPRVALPSWRDWCFFALQIALVASIELVDDGVRGVLAPRDASVAQANALHIMQAEQNLGLWIEPAIQNAFLATHRLFGLLIDQGVLNLLVTTLYGAGHVLITLVFSSWIFWRHRALFPFLRNAFVCTTALAVLLYNTFPLAPPRLASGLLYDGHPYHFADLVFGAGGGVKLSFDEFAAMPSLHVCWALLVGGTVALIARPLAVRLLAAIYPIVMALAVIVTGNHYLADALVAALVVLVALLLAWAASRFAPRLATVGA